MNKLEQLAAALEVLADLGTIGATVIAVLVFFRNGDDIKSFMQTFTNFAHRDSMSDLRIKIEVLSNLHASDQSNSTEISSMILEICGQIDGSPFLRGDLSDISSRMRQATAARKIISEPQKRALLSELREIIRHLDYGSVQNSSATGGFIKK